MYLFVVLFATSCLTVRQIERNCDQFYAICVTQETETTTIHDTAWIERRDTIVNYLIERDTVEKVTYLPSIERSVSSDTSYLTTGLASSTAFIWRSQLFHTLESGDTILNIRLNDALTQVNHLHRELSEKTRTVTVREDTSFGKFCKKWFFGTLILVFLGILVAVLRIKKVF